MELSQVLERLKFTIDKAKTLKEEQFNYGSFVTKFDKTNNCGTVCCIAGHYPNWGIDFLEYRYIDLDLVLDCRSNNYQTIGDALKDFHGLSEDLVSYLFYGLNVLSPFFYQDSFSSSYVRRNYDLSLGQVIKRFENVYNLLETGQITPDFEEDSEELRF